LSTVIFCYTESMQETELVETNNALRSKVTQLFPKQMQIF
jgi:hypothetical protein